MPFGFLFEAMHMDVMVDSLVPIVLSDHVILYKCLLMALVEAQGLGGVVKALENQINGRILKFVVYTSIVTTHIPRWCRSGRSL